SDVQRRRLSQVINIWLKRQTERGNNRGASGLLQHVKGCSLHLVDDPLRFGIIDLSSATNNRGSLWCSRHNKPRINRNTVASNTGARLQNVHARVTVGQFNDFPNIHADLVADHRQLIGKRNIHVAERVFNQLRHLSGPSVRGDQFCFTERTIQLNGPLGGLRGGATDDAVVGDQFTHDLARQYPFRRMGKLQGALLGQIWAFFVNDLGQTIRGAWRRRGFKNHELITGQLSCQGPTSRFNVRQVRG